MSTYEKLTPDELAVVQSYRKAQASGPRVYMGSDPSMPNCPHGDRKYLGQGNGGHMYQCVMCARITIE